MALTDRIIPQPADTRIDLAARIDAQLAAAQGDGWRYAELPPDAAAYRAALQTLNAWSLSEFERPYAALDAPAQDLMIEWLCTSPPPGHAPAASLALTLPQMIATKAVASAPRRAWM